MNFSPAAIAVTGLLVLAAGIVSAFIGALLAREAERDLWEERLREAEEKYRERLPGDVAIEGDVYLVMQSNGKPDPVIAGDSAVLLPARCGENVTSCWRLRASAYVHARPWRPVRVLRLPRVC